MYNYEHIIKKLKENDTHTFFKKLTNKKIIKLNQKCKKNLQFETKTKFDKAI